MEKSSIALSVAAILSGDHLAACFTYRQLPRLLGALPSVLSGTGEDAIRTASGSHTASKSMLIAL